MSTLDLHGSLTRNRRRLRLSVLAVVVIAAVAAGIWWWLANRPPDPTPTAEAFAGAWNRGDLSAAPVVDAAAVADRYEEIVAGMGESPVEVSLGEVIVNEEDGARATAEFDVAWTLPGDRDWSYEVTAPLELIDDAWFVRWSESVVHPDLLQDGTLRMRRTNPSRGDIVATDGTPIVTLRPVVDVGIQPSRVEDLDETVTTVSDLLDVDADALRERVESAGPDHFVPVLTLREDDYLDVENELYPVPGTVFRRDEWPLAPTREFARATLGVAGPVTAELIEEHPERYQAGDIAGLSGLQRAYDEVLAGAPGLAVTAEPPEQMDQEPTTLFEAAPEDGEDVVVTFDVEVQRAADAALAGVTDHPAALVAIRVSDGHVLAAANGPEAGGNDLALTGRYPPGSTFKVVTTAALLADGLTPDDEVGCPDRAVVDGRAFSNAEDAALGDVPFRTAFAESCNTAFVQLAEELGADALQTAGGWFGLGRERDLGASAFGGDVPETERGTDHAAAAIGQGRVLASPLAMADVAATAARGGWAAPRLVVADEEPGGDVEVEPLPDEVAATLPDLMRLVVTEGSGQALADVPGAPVHGKTGTAEYGDESPPRTHAWFIGWQDDLAFAVIVAETDGDFGGRVAAPIAADFLSNLGNRDD